MDAAYVVTQHLVYLALSLGVTWGVGRTLHANGAVFLIDAFKGKERLAESVNHLLVVGFYLVNGGWVVRAVRSAPVPTGVPDIITNIAGEFGGVLLLLGVMHFINVYVFNRMRLRAEQSRHSSPPVRPSEFLSPRAPAPVAG